ncbi:transglycosylase domain-containing protein [Flammeovirga sp. SJP92]|uniref:transglycosylase domain-containing protein n=1 Tax=Flammeovirga sp. SJP92 TaxID=1775430 RepID=UPI0009EEC372|nr:transglycosylase domain-containing protein [Flammeovirga sp. SJP92]
MFVPFLKRLAVLTIIAHISFFAYIALGSLYVKWANPSMSMYMCVRSHFDLNDVVTPKFIPKESIPTDLQTAIVGLDDPTFNIHRGYDNNSMSNTATISQKVARSMFLFPHQNNLGSYLETLAAVEMECILDKDRILELYLNYSEWGDNIYGIGEAADYYYKKDIQNLSRRQKLKLASVLAKPLEVDPSTYDKNKIVEARFNLLNKLMD